MHHSIMTSKLSRRTSLRSLAMLALGGVASATPLRGLASLKEERSTGNREQWRAFVRALPKAELHLHVEGITNPSLAFELAERNRIDLPFANPEAFEKSLVFTSLESFLAGYEQMLRVLRTGEDFRDVALHYFRNARERGIVYAELHFDPQAHMERDIAFDEIVEGIGDAQRIAERELGVRSRLIMALQRDRDSDSAWTAYRHALAHREKIAGLGLDNYEANNFPAKFIDLYHQAARDGFQLTSHCDLEVPNSLAHIRSCLKELKVSRLDHGYSVLDSDELTAHCMTHGVALTACPTTDWNHPDPMTDYYVAAVTRSVGLMLKKGLRVSLNSDDPGLMGDRYIDDIYLDVGSALNLGRDDLLRLSRNSFESIWAPEEEKAAYLDALDAFNAANTATI